jgi:predicted nucleic acid-binding protein
MNGKPFLDTNVIVYAFHKDDSRSEVAATLLASGGTLSVQVLNEFVNVARRKLGKGWKDISKALQVLRVFCPEPLPITIETHEAALRIAEQYGYRIYDSLVLAAALESSCGVLYSEDLQDGQKIEGLTIINPFRME